MNNLNFINKYLFFDSARFLNLCGHFFIFLKVAKDNGLGISLFKRLKKWFEQNQYAQKNKSISILDTQYRMHNEICLFPSQYFYGGKIKTAPSVKTRVQLPFQPYIILEHESLQDNSGYGIIVRSYFFNMFLINNVL